MEQEKRSEKRNTQVSPIQVKEAKKVDEGPEKTHNERHADNDQQDSIQEISMDSSCESINASKWNIFRIPVILLACILNTSIVTLIPRHNSILYPNYWFETIFVFILAYCINTTANVLLELFVFTRVHELLSVRNILKIFLICSLSFTLTYSLCCFIWNICIGYNHPLPFIGLCGITVEIVILLMAKFLFPLSLMKEEKMKKKIKYYIFYRIWIIVLELQNNAISFIFRILSSDLQWIVAILIPIVRSANSFVVSKIVEKGIGTHDDLSQCLVVTTIKNLYAYYVAIQLSSASISTVYFMLFVELGLNLFGCYEVIRSKRKSEDVAGNNVDQLNSKLNVEMMSLSIGEFIEAFVPLTFGIGYATAYWGSNSDLIRNVGNDYFGGEIKDRFQIYFVMFQLFSIDVISVALTAACLQHFCKISFFQECCNMLNKYWILLTIKLSGNLAMYFLYNDINFAMDYSLLFTWTSDDGRSTLILNSHESSREEKESLLQNITVW